MTNKTPGAGRTAREGEAIGESDSTNLVALSQNFNLSNLERQKAPEYLGLKSTDLCGADAIFLGKHERRRCVIDRVSS